MTLTAYYISIACVATIMESLRKLLRAVTGTESVRVILNLKKKNEYGLCLTMSTADSGLPASKFDSFG